MTVLDIIKEVASRTEKDLTQTISNNETLKSFLFRSFNFIHKNFNARFLWPWTEKTTTIVTTPNYTTGSVTVTQGLRTVTGIGTTFTSAMIGRFLKLEREDQMYEILDVPNGLTLTLVDSYIGTSGSSLSYRIYRRYYELPPDCPFGGNMVVWSWPRRGVPLRFRNFDDTFRLNFITGVPFAWTWHGINRRLSTYNTGTVSVTVNDKTLTGVSTLFLGNVFPGSRIIIGINTYNIESVDSNTQITMVQNALVTVANSTYRIETKNRSQIILSSVPDPAINLFLTYHKRTYDFVNDNDESEVWEEYQIALANMLYAYLLDKLTDNRSLSWLTIADAQVRQVLSSLQEFSAIDEAPLVQKTSLSGYRAGLYD